MSEKIIYDDTPIIYLAMFWGGGGPYTISQIMHVYDWINRGIPTREDLEKALNTLLALNFIEMKDDKFLVTRKIGKDFDVFRKKKRNGKFKIVRMYFEKFDLSAKFPRVVKISKKLYSDELKKYHKFMDS